MDDIRSARSGSRASNSDSGGLESSRAMESCGRVSTASRNGGRIRRRSRSASGVDSADDWACLCWRRSLARESRVEAAEEDCFGSGGVAVAMARSRR